MINPKMKLLAIVISIHVFGKVVADFEVCNPGVSYTVYRFMYDNCPFGVLFDHPILVNCLASTNFPEHFMTDLCSPESSGLIIDDQPYQIHLAFQMDPEPVDPDSSCFGMGPDKCDVESITDATIQALTPPLGPECESGYENDTGSLTPEEEARRRDQYVFSQTERLFKYMLGLIDDEKITTGPTIRLLRDVFKAFVFLFRDSDVTNFKDISVEDFEQISKTLAVCESMRPPFSLVGRSCETCANVHSIEKLGKILRYTENEFEFVWGKYDVPTDATWNVITFVHGLCYGTYRLHVNYHHLYEQEMERLFTPEILYRWSRPPLLYHEDLWDHIFSTSVKNAMRALDISIFGAYHEVPFLHRLERPMEATDPNGRKRRKKRSLLPTMSLDEDGGLQGAGWCFQTEEELVGTVTAYMSYHCPDVPVPKELTKAHSLNTSNSNEFSNSNDLPTANDFSNSNAHRPDTIIDIKGDSESEDLEL